MIQETSKRRKRGVVLTADGQQKLQTAIRQVEQTDNFGEKYTLEDLSDRTSLDPGTVAKVLDAKEGADRRTLERFFQTFDLTLEENDYCKLGLVQRESQIENETSISTVQNRVDWSEAVDVSIFYGRTAELEILERWIVSDRCHLVAVLGMGGIGKTSLAAKLGQQVQGEFQYVVWRSLRESPPLAETLMKLIQFLSDQQVTKGDLSESVGEQINKMLEYLRTSRCLVILDNAESIFQEGQAGVYRAGYEGYGEMLRRIGEASHQSCVVLTSREKPREIAALEGETLPVRSLYLRGLGSTGGQEILKAKGLASAEVESQGNELIDRCSGNPLLLKLIATDIREGFEGKVAEFLQQNPTIAIGEARRLLDQQFARLSELEKAVMYWLAINREPTTIQELQDDIIPAVLKPKLIEALNTLRSRSLVETVRTKYTQQPVIMEYMTGRLIEKAIVEIASRELLVFEQFALSKATAKDYVRETQHRLILQPIAAHLLAQFRDENRVANEIQQILQECRSRSKTGYAAGNAIGLAAQLKLNLTGWNFSGLSVWQADLKNITLDQVDFTGTNFSKTSFTEALGTVFALALSPDGQRLATGDSQNTLCLWETTYYQQIAKSREGYYNHFNSMCFSPDGQIIASTGDTSEAKLWSAKTGQLIKVLKGHTRELRSIAFSPDGRLVATASSDCTIRVWDVETGSCTSILEGHLHSVSAVVFSLDGTVLASGSTDSTVRLWEVSTKKCFRVLEHQIQSSFDMAISFMPDSKTLAIGGDNFTIRFWDVQTGECVRTFFGHSAPVRVVKITPDGQTLISSSEDTTIKVWCIQSGQCLRTLKGHDSIVRQLDFNFKRRIIVSTADAQVLKIWNMETGECLSTVYGYSKAVRTIAFSPNSQILASGSDDGIARLWDVNTGGCVHAFKPHPSRIFTLAFHPNNSILLTRDHDEVIRLWSIESSDLVKTLVGELSQ